MMMTLKRPSNWKIRRRFPQYGTIDKCPPESQVDYLNDLYFRIILRKDFDSGVFMEFMEVVNHSKIRKDL